VRDVRAVKDMIDAKMADRGHERRNVKLGVGGIREIEFFVQTIQVLAGNRVPALLDRSTLGALGRFVRRKLISAKERDAITAAYVFLRDVEHKLQMVHDLQTHALPDEEDELERCAIRMGYDGADHAMALKQFQTDHAAHRTIVHDIFRSFFDSPKTSPHFKATLRAMAATR
jgi:glutamate-ammonia-ligase adenylyltransferase